MEAEISSLRHNPLLERTEIEVKISHEGEPTPSQEDVKDRLAAEEDWNSDELEVVTVKTGFGSNESTARLKLYQDIDLERYEDQLEEETVEPDQDTDSTSKSGPDYEEIVSGTIGEAKESLNGMEDPDYEKALEAEKNNKDRKTMKEWLENQKD